MAALVAAPGLAKLHWTTPTPLGTLLPKAHGFEGGSGVDPLMVEGQVDAAKAIEDSLPIALALARHKVIMRMKARTTSRGALKANLIR